MNVLITGRHTDVPEAVHDYVEKKLGRLSKYLPNISDAKVEITWENTRSSTGQFVVQVTVQTARAILRGEVRDPSVHAAIDTVAEVMERQIERYKGRHDRSKAAAAMSNAEPATDVAIGEEEEEGEQAELEVTAGRIVRTKRIPMKPMSAGEAVEQMELLGHTFFVFQEPEHRRFHVVYKRRDGDYGVIEPEPI